MQRRARLTIAGGLYCLALVAYAVSFFLPTFVGVDGGIEGACYGYEAFFDSLINAWMLRGSCPLLAWLANPLFWAGAVLWLMNNGRATASLAGLALLFAILSTVALIPMGISLRVGYYLWLVSLVLLGIAGWCLPRRRFTHAPDGGPDGVPKLAVRLTSCDPTPPAPGDCLR